MIDEIESGVIEFPEDMDEQFVDALKKMTQLDWNARPTAEECLLLPIFAGAQTKDGYIRVNKGGNAMALSGTWNMKTTGKRLMKAVCRTGRTTQIMAHET
jgi:hypothetical protein